MTWPRDFTLEEEDEVQIVGEHVAPVPKAHWAEEATDSNLGVRAGSWAFASERQSHP